jgi:gluconokinase
LPVFLPFLYGERSPGYNANRRAAFENLQPEHTIGDLYSSVLEGVLMTIYQCYLKLAAVSPINRINLSGGILKAPVWAQMAADILQHPLEIPDTAQAWAARPWPCT